MTETQPPSGTPTLPVRRLTLYKHGVGVVERAGAFAGDELRLDFRAPEVNDALKSLLVLDRGGGQVLGVHYETPADRAARLAEGPIDLSPDHTLLDLLRGLRGTVVRLVVGTGTQVQVVEGRLLGPEVAEGDPARRALVSVWDEARGGVVVQPLSAVREVVLGEDRSARDVRHFLDVSRSEDTRRTVTVRLSPGEHDLAVSYLVPSPTWRVSYRLVAEAAAPAPESGRGGAGGAGGRGGTLLLQGWGLFDNRLEEDLRDVQVTLVAGQPISFVYDLATSRIPPRRVVQDEARVAAAPVEFERAVARRRGVRAESAFGGARDADAAEVMAPMAAAAPMPPEAAPMAFRASIAEVEQQAVAAAGEELGELFQYQVAAPVTVGRGGSALVPILGSRLPYRRELLFNQQKVPQHPVAALRFTNDTGLVLERGPVTVLEDGDYRGEAIVPFSRQGSEVYLAFAVELGVTVRQTRETRMEQAGLRIEKALLWMKQARIVETTYLIASDLDAAEMVTVEHPIMTGFELLDTRPPDEETPEWYRWAVPCPPRDATSFVVRQRRFDWQQQALLDLSYDALREYLTRRWLDRPTLERIRSLLQERQTIARNKEEAGELQAERDRIYQREEQLRQNLTALSQTGQEAALRQQVFRQLEASETRLNAIDARIAALVDENRQRQAALEAALESLAVEEVGDDG
jgi:hypothetical protein